MTVFISYRAINLNTLEQNCAVSVGQHSGSGWDANMKLNIAHGADFGFSNVGVTRTNCTFDGMEVIDGVMNDQDTKISPSIKF